MSLKNTKNLIIIAAVVVAVLAGTVLLGNYTNILSTGSDTGSQPKACQATGSTACTASQAVFAQNAEIECAGKTECGSVAKTCPADASKPCCAVTGSCPKESGSCPKTACEEGCTKPCCVETGSCPKSEATAATAGCCPKVATATE